MPVVFTGTKSEPGPRPEPESDPGPAPESGTLPEPKSESESEPGPGAGQTNQDINPNQNPVENPKHKRKSKTKPKPPPESHIISKLTHINLNKKLEYNRSTIPDPCEIPPTEEEIRNENEIKDQIAKLRTENLKAKKQPPKPNPIPNPIPKPKSKKKRKPRKATIASIDDSTRELYRDRHTQMDNNHEHSQAVLNQGKMKVKDITHWLMMDNTEGNMDMFEQTLISDDPQPETDRQTD